MRKIVLLLFFVLIVLVLVLAGCRKDSVSGFVPGGSTEKVVNGKPCSYHNGCQSNFCQRGICTKKPKAAIS